MSNNGGGPKAVVPFGPKLTVSPKLAMSLTEQAKRFWAFCARRSVLLR